MSTPNVVLTKRGEKNPRNASEVTRVRSLEAAATVGFTDLAEGRYCEIADDDLDAVIGKLGKQASGLVRGGRH
jgi:hypothetical protein